MQMQIFFKNIFLTFLEFDGPDIDWEDACCVLWFLLFWNHNCTVDYQLALITETQR